MAIKAILTIGHNVDGQTFIEMLNEDQYQQNCHKMTMFASPEEVDRIIGALKTEKEKAIKYLERKNENVGKSE